MQDEHLEALIELRALWTSATRVGDLVLKGSIKTTSLAASLSSVVDLIKGHINVVTANGVHWGTRLALITTLSQFPKLEPELELLGSGHNADLTENQLDALWTRTRRASESLSSSVLPSNARNSPGDTREE
jgi:hypothetical protein